MLTRHRLGVSLLVAFIPACALVGGLPFVNRLDPTVLGLPFLLVWILGWVMLTPLFLFAAYRLQGSHEGEASATRPGADSNGFPPASPDKDRR